MKKIIFVCLGNICRSPMAEFVMKDIVEKAGLSHEFEIASAATSTYEIGNPVYPPARQKLAEHGIDCKGKTARQITKKDYDYYGHGAVPGSDVPSKGSGHTPKERYEVSVLSVGLL